MFIFKMSEKLALGFYLMLPINPDEMITRFFPAMWTEFTNELKLRILHLFSLEILDVLISNIPFQKRFNLKNHLQLWHTSMILSFEGRYISLRPAWTTKKGARSKQMNK